MYSRIMVESKICTSPSMSVGTSKRGLAVMRSASGVPFVIASGTLVVKGMSFSRRAIRIFWAYEEAGWS